MINDLVLYAVISIFTLIIISKISYKLNLIDLPNERKIHHIPTAYTGGIGLSILYIFSIYLFEIHSGTLNLILSIGFMIALVGLIDDKYELNVGSKLSLQIIPIIYLIVSQKLNLIHLGEYDYFKLELNSFSIPFTIIAILFLINSFNYIDGIDGSLSFTTISTLCILFYLSNDKEIELFLIIISVPLILFLLFNFSILKFKKLFLGNSGSLLLGFIIAFTLIYLANQKIVHPILLAFSVSIFVYEFLSINFIRLKNNQKLFEAGQDHLHHLLLKKTKSNFMTNFIIFFSNIFLFILGYISFLSVSPVASLILFMILFLVFIKLRNNI